MGTGLFFMATSTLSTNSQMIAPYLCSIDACNPVDFKKLAGPLRAYPKALADDFERAITKLLQSPRSFLKVFQPAPSFAHNRNYFNK